MSCLFFAWLDSQPRQPFSKPLVGEYRAHLLERKLSPSTQKLGLSPLRKLAREMSENGLLDPGIASAIERTKGVKRRGEGRELAAQRTGQRAFECAGSLDFERQRDGAILALLILCGLRRAELVSLEVDRIQQREGRWVTPEQVSWFGQRTQRSGPQAA